MVKAKKEKKKQSDIEEENE